MEEWTSLGKSTSGTAMLALKECEKTRSDAYEALKLLKKSFDTINITRGLFFVIFILFYGFIFTSLLT